MLRTQRAWSRNTRVRFSSIPGSYQGVKNDARHTVACLPILAVGFFCGNSSCAQAQSVQQIKVLTLLGASAAGRYCGDARHFAKYGVDVETQNLPNSDVLRASLAAGKAISLTLPWITPWPWSSSLTRTCHRDGRRRLAERIDRAARNKSIKDLAGKTLIVDAPNTAYALQMKKILLLKEMHAGKDYEIKPFGATPQRLIAMRERKENAGSMLGPPSSIVAKREASSALGSVQDLIGPYQAAGYFTQRAWAQEHRGALENISRRSSRRNAG